MQLVANIYHCIAPYAIESDWDDVYAPRLVGFPLNVFYAKWIQVRDVCFRSEYICCGEQSRQMRYRPTVDFSVLVVLHIEGRMETFKYSGSALLCDASGPDFRTAMIHTTACGLALDEPIDHQDLAWQPGD